MSASLLAQDPIFIVGCPRSGTTLLQALLSTQKNIVSFPETHYFSETLKAARFLESGAIDGRCTERLYSAIRSTNRVEFDGDTKRTLDTLAEGEELTIKDLFEALVLALLRLSLSDDEIHVSRWIEKTPFHFWHCKTILDLYPNAHIIGVIRHVVPVVHSRKAKIPTDAGSTYKKLAQDWNLMHSAFQELETIAPENVTIVRYEDFVSDFVSGTASLCSRTGIPFDEGALAEFRTESQKLVQNDEKWKSDVQLNRIVNTNNASLKEMRIRDILEVQRVCYKNLGHHGYEIYRPVLQRIYNQVLQPIWAFQS